MSLLLDGWSAVLAEAERAWVTWMWKQESRVQRDADHAGRRDVRTWDRRRTLVELLDLIGVPSRSAAEARQGLVSARAHVAHLD